ncbi:no vein-like [Zea mays]|uniref:No vein-like n=1 Tax=Zea mays TaxID=4577 RepID=A0A1D6LT79_MAIZE|nr:no vein-like [Zea mays]
MSCLYPGLDIQFKDIPSIGRSITSCNRQNLEEPFPLFHLLKQVRK